MEDLKERSRRVFELLLRGDTEGVEDLVAEDVVDHNLPPGIPPGLEGFKQISKLLTTAFSNLNGEIEDEIQDGDVVVTRSIFRGTHTGDFFGIPATGRTFEVEGIDMVRFEGGKVVEHWGLLNQMSLLMQLGAGGPSAPEN